MADIKITMLGMTGSGKTCYLYALAHSLPQGFELYTDSDTATKLMEAYSQMDDISLPMKDRFPAGTDQIEHYCFSLKYKDDAVESVLSFDWMDYPGGTLSARQTNDNQEYLRLKKRVNDSSCLFVVVDGELLKGDDDNLDKADTIKENCSAAINSFISDYCSNNNTIPPVVIMVTKFELCMEYLCKGEERDAVKNINMNLEEIMQEAFSPLFTSDRENNNIVAIIPVSLGVSVKDEEYLDEMKGKVESIKARWPRFVSKIYVSLQTNRWKKLGCPGKLKPVNIHLPVFMAIMLTLRDRAWREEYEKKRFNEESEAAIAKLREQRRMELEKWWLFRDRQKLQRLERTIEDKISADDRETQSRQQQIQAARQNQELLIEKLDDIHLVYINGQRRSDWKDILAT